MICKKCGMDSKTPDKCSWCGAAMSTSGGAGASTVDTAPSSSTEDGDAAQDILDLTARPKAAIIVESAPVEDSAATAGTLNDYSRAAEGKPIGGTLSDYSKAVDTKPAAPGVPPRKMAPGMPPPGSKGRAPAPAAPLHGMRPVPPVSLPGAQPAPPSAPVSYNLNPDAAVDTPNTLIGNAPPSVAGIREPVPGSPRGEGEPLPNTQHRTPNTEHRISERSTPIPSLLQQAESLVNPTPPTLTDVGARPEQTLPPLGQSPPLAREKPEATIGATMTPPKAAEYPASTLTERQKRAAVDAALVEDGPSPWTLLGQYLGVFAIILLVVGVLARIAPAYYAAPMVIAMFVSALLLPIMQVSPWTDEDTEDVIWFVFLTLLFGPLIALIIYLVVAASRQAFNASVMGCFVVTAVVRIVAEAASGGVGSLGHLFAMTSPFTSLGHLDSGVFKVLLLNWAGFAALAGWYAASSFHKEDE